MLLSMFTWPLDMPTLVICCKPRGLVNMLSPITHDYILQLLICVSTPSNDLHIWDCLRFHCGHDVHFTPLAQYNLSVLFPCIVKPDSRTHLLTSLPSSKNDRVTQTYTKVHPKLWGYDFQFGLCHTVLASQGPLLKGSQADSSSKGSYS